MNINRDKNKKVLSSLLGTLLCLLNSNVSFAMINRPSIAEYYIDQSDDGEDEGETSASENLAVDLKNAQDVLKFVVPAFIINKKAFLSDSSVLDDISSGFKRYIYSGYEAVGALADVLGLSTSEVADAVTFGGKSLTEAHSAWAKEIKNLAEDMSKHHGWVSNMATLSTYWKLAVSVKTDLDLSFGKNTMALMKKLISNRSHLGTPLVVNKEKTIGEDCVKPFTEDGGFKSDGLHGDPYTTWFLWLREPTVGAGKTRKSLFSVNSAMEMTYHLLYGQQQWDKNLMVCGHNLYKAAPDPLENVTPDPEEDVIYGEKNTNNKWAFKIGNYVYVRVPTKWLDDVGAPDIFGRRAPNSTWAAGLNAKGAVLGNIPIFSNDPNNSFLDSLKNHQENVGGQFKISLKTWLNSTKDIDSSQPSSRYIAIPLK